MIDYEGRYYKLCAEIKVQCDDIRKAFQDNDLTSNSVRTTAGIFERIVDKSLQESKV